LSGYVIPSVNFGKILFNKDITLKSVRRYMCGTMLLVFLSCIKVDPSGPYPIRPGEPKDTLKTDVSAWITSPYNNILFQRQNVSLFFANVANMDPVINIDTNQTYQSIDGFGNCLTGGSAILIHRMESESRLELLKELFATDGKNIGISYLRISIGASDLSDHVFSYDDLPAGQTDAEMSHFSIDHEKTDLIPVLREILLINPKIMIMGSPWSAPAWMKTNGNAKGGSLRTEYFDAYAKYFVKYIQAMKSEGINIDAITIQNEPLYAGNNPSMFMSAEDQASFIKLSLGPAFVSAGITTKIIVYDHNADRPDYPMSIYADPDASKYVDGAAFHLYGGSINALTAVHNAFPEKNLYFTEQWVGAPGNLPADLAWHVKTLIIGGMRNWCRNVLEWNMASDPGYDPHTTDGGCSQCMGTVTLSGNIVTRNPAYYILAHSAKFVRPGSVRIYSDVPDKLPNVAFRTPGGKKVLIVLNDSSIGQRFNVKFKGKSVSFALDQGAVGTFVW
jgi:glucosylceramidase